MLSSAELKIVVADDEIHIQKTLTELIGYFPGARVAASVDNGIDALEAVRKHNPTAIFMDIAMPQLNGLVAAAELRAFHPDLFLVFVTADSSHACTAFNLGAVDYLIKPLTRETVFRALNRIKQYAAIEFGSHLGPTNIKAERLQIRNGHEIAFVSFRDIIFITKIARKTVVHTRQAQYHSSDPLQSFEKMLGSDFFRCHKGYIINLAHVEKIIPLYDRLYQVCFYNYPEKAEISKNKLDEMIDLLHS